MLRKTAMLLVAGFVIMSLVGCGSIQKKSPHMGFGMVDIQGQFQRDCFEIIGPVEGTSFTDKYFFGLVQIIDGHVKLFFIPFYEEKYAFQPGFDSILVNLIGPSTAERAYYHALSKTPDSDTVFVKSFYSRTSGFLPLYSNETVTFRGKALKLKPDEK